MANINFNTEPEVLGAGWMERIRRARRARVGIPPVRDEGKAVIEAEAIMPGDNGRIARIKVGRIAQIKATPILEQGSMRYRPKPTPSRRKWRPRMCPCPSL